MTTDTRSPTVEEWVSALDLTRRGSEFVGPCPVCGGDDRFHVREGNGRAVFGCRSCIDGRTTTEKQEAGGAILRRVFPDRGTARSGPGSANSSPAAIRTGPGGKQAPRRAGSAYLGRNLANGPDPDPALPVGPVRVASGRHRPRTAR